MKNLILIDTSWVLHRMWHVHQDLQVTLHNGEVLKSGHLYGMCRLLKSLTSKYPAADIVCCLDGVAEHGKSLNADYKANRGVSSVRTAFDDLGVVVECAVAFPRVRVAFHRSLEADEVIAYLARAWGEQYEQVIIYSADCDMLQLMAEGNVVISKEFERDGSLKLVTPSVYYNDQKYVDKFAGVDFGLLPLFRAMVGDGSDNLAGFPRLRKKVAKELVEFYGNIEDLERGCLKGETSPIAFPKGFADFIPKLKTNYEIMRLPTPTDLELRGELPKVYERESDEEARALFSLYRIRSVSPVETVLVSAEDEGSYLAVRDSVNSNWRHPNSLKG